MDEYIKIFEWKVKYIILFEFRSDNNIKNYFYSKLRRELRKIIKELLSDPHFNINYIDNGLISLSKITHEYLYKILKKQNYIFIDNIDKEVVCKFLLLNEESRFNPESQCNNIKSFDREIKDLNLNSIDSVKNNINKNPIDITHNINYSNKEEGFLIDNIIIEVENSKGVCKIECNSDITVTESLVLKVDKTNFDLCSQQKLFNEEENYEGTQKKENLFKDQDCNFEDINKLKNETKQIFEFFLEQNEGEINNCFTYLSALEK